MNINDVTRIWENLKSNDAIYVSEEIYNKGNVKLELRMIRGSYILTMLLSTSDSFDKYFRNIGFKGMDFVYRETEAGKEIDVTLLEETLLAPFNGFLLDFYSKMEEVVKATHAVDMLFNTLSTWLKLFKAVNNQALSEEAQLGLFGELYFIYKLLKRGKSSPDVISKWTGPDKSDKDFIFNNCSVEVKATKVSAPSIGISSENQLNNVLGTDLFLSLYVFDFVPGSRNTLNSIIKEIKEMIIDSAIVDLFVEKLEEAGYYFKDEELYNNKSYALRDEKYFIINEAFPKIIYGKVASGVHKVSYSIEISACLNYIETYENIEKLV
jgi:hypothetical protein